MIDRKIATHQDLNQKSNYFIFEKIMMKKLFLKLRATIFYAGFSLFTIWFSITGSLFLSFFPYKIRLFYITGWNRCTITWAKWICGINYQISGTENIPVDQPYVALSKHQSQWETFFLQHFLAPVSIVLKQELLKVPFFGWGLRLTSPIAINRDNPREALKQIQEQGTARISDQISVLIFPEGTRMEPGTAGKYARGGANIAIASGAPVIPIAHNAGVFWPSDKFVKFPGTISIVIGKPIHTEGKTSREITDQVKNWIENEVNKMPLTVP